jgi:hypothetical protein
MNKNELTGRLKAIIERNSEFTTWTVSTPHLLMLVEEAVKEEREACAKACEKFGYDNHHGVITDQIATAIRARGQE